MVTGFKNCLNGLNNKLCSYFSFRFESFNSIIRQMNIFSNRQACSRDICNMYAKHHTLKYIINGGFWGDDYRLPA